MLALRRSISALTCLPALTVAAASTAPSCSFLPACLVYTHHRRTMSLSSPKELSPSNLRALRDYWFEGMPDTLTEEEPMPSVCSKKWYKGGDEVDAYCR